MNEKIIRKYIQKEIRLSEAAGDMGHSDFVKISGAFKNIFKVSFTGLKQILSALVLNIEVLISLDRQSAITAFKAYESRSQRIAAEYENLLKDFDTSIEDFMPFVFLVNPGAYISYRFADDASKNFSFTRDYLQSLGINVGYLSWDPRIDTPYKALLNGLFSGTGPTTNLSVGGTGDIVSVQKQIQDSLNKLFRIKDTVSESKEINPQTSVSKSINIFFKDVLPNQPLKLWGIKEDLDEKISKLKIDQANEMIKMLNAPEVFLKSLKEAKTLDDVKKSISLLKNTPYKINGFEKITPDFLEKSSLKALSAAKKNNKLETLFKQIGQKIPDNEEDQVKAIKAYQLRNLLGNAVITSSQSLSEEIENLREEFLKYYTKDVSLSELEKVAPDSKLLKIMKQNIERINKTGKQQNQ